MTARSKFELYLIATCKVGLYLTATCKLGLYLTGTDKMELIVTTTGKVNIIVCSILCLWSLWSVSNLLTMSISDKKSLKTPKGQSESVNRRRTDNTMANRKNTKGQTTIYKTYT